MDASKDPIEIWRCACGHFSHARKRPSTHVRTEKLYDSDGEPMGGQKVVCGPFSRWRAVYEDIEREPPPSVGTVVSSWPEADEDDSPIGPDDIPF